jgi:hypothetical protein
MFKPGTSHSEVRQSATTPHTPGWRESRVRCLAQGRVLAGFELTTCWLGLRHTNHYYTHPEAKFINQFKDVFKSQNFMVNFKDFLQIRQRRQLPGFTAAINSYNHHPCLKYLTSASVVPFP